MPLPPSESALQILVASHTLLLICAHKFSKIDPFKTFKLPKSLYSPFGMSITIRLYVLFSTEITNSFSHLSLCIVLYFYNGIFYCKTGFFTGNFSIFLQKLFKDKLIKQNMHYYMIFLPPTIVVNIL